MFLEGQRVLFYEHLRFREGLEERFGLLLFGVASFRRDMIDKYAVGGLFWVESFGEVVGVVFKFFVFGVLFGFLESDEVGLPGNIDMSDEHFIVQLN